MEKEKFEIWMMEYLSDALDGKGRNEFEKFLEDHPEHQKQFDGLGETWNQIDSLEIPDPSEKMDRRFFEMLWRETDKGKKIDDASETWLSSLLASLWKPQMAYGILLLLIGLMAGYFLNSGRTVDPAPTIQVSNHETEEVREKLVLTLLEQPSANKRLQAVNEATKLNDANERIIKALFTTLNNDPNINVRLAAIESLARYVETPEVRMGLVKSITLQDSPLVQIGLADLMVALQERTSIESMQLLLEKPDIDTTVKQKLEESINHIL